MNLKKNSSLFCASLFIFITALTAHAQANYTRDANQAVDEDYTRKIAEYTTEKFFNSPLTDYLPASPNVPTARPRTVAPMAWAACWVSCNAGSPR